MSTNDDFGFTFISKDVIKEEAKDAKSQILARVLPFLKKLKGNDSDVINWPHEQRHEQIDNFIKELENLGE